MHLGCAIESRGKPPYGRCGGARRACAVRPCDRPGATHRDEQSPCVCVPHSPAQAVGVQLVRRAAAGAGCERGGDALRRRRSPPLRIAVCEIAGLRVAASGTPWSRMRAAVRGL